LQAGGGRFESGRLHRPGFAFIERSGAFVELPGTLARQARRYDAGTGAVRSALPVRRLSPVRC